MRFFRYAPVRKDDKAGPYYIFSPEGTLLFSHDPYVNGQTYGSIYRVGLRGLECIAKALATQSWVRFEGADPEFLAAYRKKFPAGDNSNYGTGGVPLTTASVDDTVWNNIVAEARNADTADEEARKLESQQAAQKVAEEAAAAREQANRLELNDSSARIAAEVVAAELAKHLPNPEDDQPTTVTLLSIQAEDIRDGYDRKVYMKERALAATVLVDGAPLASVTPMGEITMVYHRDLSPAVRVFYLKRLEALPWQPATSPLAMSLVQVGAVGAQLREVTVNRGWVEMLPSWAEADWKTARNAAEAVKPAPRSSHPLLKVAGVLLVVVGASMLGYLAPTAQLVQTNVQNAATAVYQAFPLVTRANSQNR